MSKEDSPPVLTKSWVFVDSQKQHNDHITRVQEVTDNEPHGDSDTESISVISESGCSYKTDEEEFAPSEEKQEVNHEPEAPEKESPEVATLGPEIMTLAETNIPPVQALNENKLIEKILYFATSAACAVILVGFSVVVQHYFQDFSSVDVFDSDQVIFPHVQNVKSEAVEDSPVKKFNKRKSQFKLDELENKIAKLQENSEFQEKIVSHISDNDLKSNNKPNKNKNAAADSNKGNCDDIKANDEIYYRKVNELKIKEDYLRKKEKFLIEKEHDLIKKEITLEKEKRNRKNKHDKRTGKHSKDESSEKILNGSKRKFNSNQEYTTNNKKYKYKEKQPSSEKVRFTGGNPRRNISGQWYMNWHQGRDNMRRQKSRVR